MLWPSDVRVKTPRPAGGGAAAVRSAGLSSFAGFTLRRLARTPSTQDAARAAARAGAPEGWTCVAAEQTAGRGRQGRRWQAPPGSALLVSVLLRPAPALMPGLPFACGLAVADAVEAVAGVRAGLKWPNDVLAGGGKLAGILVELEPRAAGGPAAAAGVGLNLGVEEFPPGVHGASLHRLCGRAVAADDALAALLVALGTRLAELRHGGVAATVAAWRPRAVGLGAPVAVEAPRGRVEGTAVGVADDGALLVDRGGEVVRLLAGDVHLVG
jgi:BirA family biotin operon repressor/biotin-[acetyl-CoA-carboxylase] ligase